MDEYPWEIIVVGDGIILSGQMKNALQEANFFFLIQVSHDDKT